MPEHWGAGCPHSRAGRSGVLRTLPGSEPGLRSSVRCPWNRGRSPPAGRPPPRVGASRR
ncbi:hypothetical protein ACFFX0_20430 [Citricoccus parietis]|uniref:Uncharacterized protein n=1 Tax=Citricoccus parietis TaxID=592307 RepID=A0ABV5G3D4_9MICC